MWTIGSVMGFVYPPWSREPTSTWLVNYHLRSSSQSQSVHPRNHTNLSCRYEVLRKSGRSESSDKVLKIMPLMSEKAQEPHRWSRRWSWAGRCSGSPLSVFQLPLYLFKNYHADYTEQERHVPFSAQEVWQAQPLKRSQMVAHSKMESQSIDQVWYNSCSWQLPFSAKRSAGAVPFHENPKMRWTGKINSSSTDIHETLSPSSSYGDQTRWYLSLKQLPIYA